MRLSPDGWGNAAVTGEPFHASSPSASHAADMMRRFIHEALASGIAA